MKKDDAEMNRAFGSGPQISVLTDGKPKMVTIMLFGDARGVECAEQLINEAVENRDQKQKQRHKVSYWYKIPFAKSFNGVY